MPVPGTPIPEMPEPEKPAPEKRAAPEQRVAVISCGQPANESEIKAIKCLKSGLLSDPDGGAWALLTNLSFSATDRFQSDEIDIVAVGPPGARVIEVKHWTAQYMKDHTDLVDREAEKITSKAKKIGAKLRKILSQQLYVEGVFLLTETPARVRDVAGNKYRGVAVCALADWKAAVHFETPAGLSAEQVKRLAHALKPRSVVPPDGSLRRFGDYTDLKLQTPRESRFHRIYKGRHASRDERVRLHLYDLSAGGKSSDANARREEYDVLHRLQEHRWAPRILDSWQPAPGYAGEMSFFTVAEPAAPSIRERAASDETWDTAARLRFARAALRALAEMHAAAADGKPLLHRNLTPEAIRVRHEGHDDIPVLDSPLLTSGSAAAAGAAKKQNETAAPEVLEQDLSAAACPSDVYSLCLSLRVLFRGRQDENSVEALKTLDLGAAREPKARAKLKDLETSFAKLLGEELPPPPPPSARFWSEGQTVPFSERDYRIVDRPRADDSGALFKVVEVGRSGDDLGTYAARVEYEREAGERVVESCNLARAHPGRHEALAPIVETAPEWRENAFTALMTWVDGAPLQDYIGAFSPQEDEALARRWLRTLCEALQVLHRNGLLHGGVSPLSVIVSDNDNPVLTGCHSVRKLGETVTDDGIYYPPCGPHGRKAAPADDIYALAASFFHAIFNREPFLYDGAQAKERGLNWQGLDDADPVLRDFLEKAAHPDPQHRFASAEQALATLGQDERIEGAARSEQEIEWLSFLLQSYPGSRWGNRETRGLDSEFAEKTYVETAIEQALYDGICERRIRLAILCGNAGDGKTALLQRLAERLNLEKQASSQRILEGKPDGGPVVRMNLDGSAAWNGRSADELLNEFLEPFQNGPPDEDLAHLLAVNDGRLLEWIEDAGETPLRAELDSLLDGEPSDPDSHIRFVSLNERSLVGNVAPDGKAIETDFLERLLGRLYGGEENWRPCGSCSAQERCEVFRAVRVFGPSELPDAAPAEIRSRARRRLFEALQAVHLRGETHVTVRELRAALVYILFGMHSCRDYHNGAGDARPYWNRAFDPESPGRQGEALRDLARFDPALEAHPHIDRRLQSVQSADGAGTLPGREGESLGSARRRAYFEWTERQTTEAAAGDKDALDLAGGRHLRLFRGLPFASAEKLDEICKSLCRGISRLEDLPPQALDRSGAALRIVPRTPAETAFWVEKPFERFRLEANLPAAAEGIDRLHRRALLIYRYRGGQEERLTLGADLFHWLLELADGYRLGDVSTNDAFARLSIFVQRLAREDDREMFAWNPMQDEAIYRVAIEIDEQDGEAPKQRLVIRPAGRKENS